MIGFLSIFVNSVIRILGIYRGLKSDRLFQAQPTGVGIWIS
jgi:hypothetical protein